MNRLMLFIFFFHTKCGKISSEKLFSRASYKMSECDTLRAISPRAVFLYCQERLIIVSSLLEYSLLKIISNWLLLEKRNGFLLLVLPPACSK